MGMCVCRTICELFTQAFKTATMPGSSCSSATSTMAVELRAAGAVASWLKFTNQWLGVSAFMQSKAPLLWACTSVDSKFLADFVCRHDELIPLLTARQ